MKKIKIRKFSDFKLTDNKMSEILGGIGGPAIEIRNPIANGWCTAIANCADGSTISCTSRNGTCSATDYSGGDLQTGGDGSVSCWHAIGTPTYKTC